jgi:hypothetical protein
VAHEEINAEISAEINVGTTVVISGETVIEERTADNTLNRNLILTQEVEIPGRHRVRTSKGHLRELLRR